MTEPIKPALDAKEWAAFLREYPGDVAYFQGSPLVYPLAWAARCLHVSGPNGSPLFTHADVEALFTVASRANVCAWDGHRGRDGEEPDKEYDDLVLEASARAMRVADVLRSLLPPREPK